MNPVNVEIDARAFNAAMVRLAQLTGMTAETVIRSEAKAVIARALSLTKSAKIRKIRERDFGKLWFTVFGKKYKSEWRVSDSVWAELLRIRRERLANKLAARGISKQSWQRLAAKLGEPIAAPAFVGRAKTPTGADPSSHVFAREHHSRDRYSIELVNDWDSVKTFGAGGRRAMQVAITGRASFFRRNLKAGVFDDMKQVSRAYPGLTAS